MKVTEPIALVILDGYGYSKTINYNAIAHAKKNTLDLLMKIYPHTLLDAAGPAVGLLPGYPGNSEVGHLTIGAGRTIVQPITFIHDAIQDGSFYSNPVLINTLQTLPPSKKLHLIGLVSDGGVHSHIEHLFAYIKAAHNAGINTIVIHALLDGRDSSPRSAPYYLEQLQKYLTKYGAIIGSIQGRFFAMDRDKNWDRTAQSYYALTQPETIKFSSWQHAINYYYAHKISDEFIPPTQLTHDGIIRNGDGIIFFNFRPDRARQLTACFIDKNIKPFERTNPQLTFFITPTDYGLTKHTTVLFKSEQITNTLKDILSNAGKRIFSIAETEKYAHITYFFNGGKEAAVPHEKRVLIQSIRTKNYIMHPEMSAQKITNAVLKSLKTDPYDFYLINYANADMVGHSGNFGATVKAIECLDAQIKKLYDNIVTKMHGTLFITADHGNAEKKWDYRTKQAHTAHTTSKVPFLIVEDKLQNSNIHLPIQSLADIAPFILNSMGILVHAEMLHKKL